MRLFITGATGFIGGHLAEALHADGHDVVASGRSGAAGAALLARGIAFRAADLLDVEGLGRAMGRPACVVHCAGRAGDWGSSAAFERDNVVGTRNVIRACRRAGVRRIVFMSTPSLYYTGRDRFEVAEADPLPARQATPYGRTKLAAERELLSLAPLGFEVIVLRPRAVYGPRDGTIAPRILRLAARPRFALIDGGRAWTDVTYIDNLVGAVRRCLAAPAGAWNRVYNLSDGQPIRIRDFFAGVLRAHGRPFRPLDVPAPAAALVAAVMECASRLPLGPREPSFTRFSVGYMARSLTMSIVEAETRLSYRPEVDPRGGLERYAAWCRGAGHGP